MNKLIWILMTLIAGAFLPIQAGLNARLGKAAANPVYAALFSFIVGTIALIIYIVFTRQTISWSGARSAPAHLWVGGLLGAFYVTVIVLAFPRLGPGLTFGLIVAGQMLVSVGLEHFNVLVTQASSISPAKIAGVILIVAGVILVRR